MKDVLDLDIALSNKLSKFSKNYSTGRLFCKILEYTFHGIPWILFAIVMIFMNFNSMWLSFILGLITDLIFVFTLKVIFQRQRPIKNNNDMLGTVSCDKYSFPSGNFIGILLLLI